MSSPLSGLTVYFPPEYNRYGNHQFWFVEFERSGFDEVLNGMLFAVFFISALVGLRVLLLGGVSP